jgi:isopenicillin N synthase-like dioxygenase
MILSNVPVIDIAPSFLDSQGKQAVSDSIRVACEDVGFFTIIGHGVSSDEINLTRQAAISFFALDLEEKLKISQPSEKISRGYNKVGERALAYSQGNQTPPDLQESFAMGPIDPPPKYLSATRLERLFHMPNIWPNLHHGFRIAMENYYRRMEELSIHILSLFALSLGLKENFFDNKTDHHTSTMRAIMYGAQSEAPKSGQLRAGEHTDYDMLTILHSDDTSGGLQVRTLKGHWIDVHPIPGSFILNIGDVMMHWTNDHWVSNLHRVSNPTLSLLKTERLSLVYFYNPDAEAEIECITSFYLNGEKAKYKKVNFGEYYLSRHMKAQHMTTNKFIGKTMVEQH